MCLVWPPNLANVSVEVPFVINLNIARSVPQIVVRLPVNINKFLFIQKYNKDFHVIVFEILFTYRDNKSFFRQNALSIISRKFFLLYWIMSFHFSDNTFDKLWLFSSTLVVKFCENCDFLIVVKSIMKVLKMKSSCLRYFNFFQIPRLTLNSIRNSLVEP